VSLHVSGERGLSRARILRSWEDTHGDVPRLTRIVGLCGPQAQVVRMDSQAKHVALAAGDGDLLLRLPPPRPFAEAIWDCAAGTILVEEAGGRVTDLAGAALDFGTGRRLTRNHGYVASNGALHEAALKAIGDAGAG
jgi:3'(2'), 5'-bisphosphate nucleotidase